MEKVPSYTITKETNRMKQESDIIYEFVLFNVVTTRENITYSAKEVATAVVEWAENKNKEKLRVKDVIMMLDNSIINKYMKEADGKDYFKGIRLLDQEGEELREGENYIEQIENNSSPTMEPETNDECVKRIQKEYEELKEYFL